MSIALLDVNVLIALADPVHVHHEAAHEWFGRNRKLGWAASPTTLNGCIRVLSDAAYPGDPQTPAEVIDRLRRFSATPEHHFWPDSVSLMDSSIFQSHLITGKQKITDVYLLGLAFRNHGRLVTFDRSIPLKAVVGAEPRNLVVIGRA